MLGRVGFYSNPERGPCPVLSLPLFSATYFETHVKTICLVGLKRNPPVSKIYDELRRAQQSKRETIPLDLLASVMEKPSSGSTAITTSEAESQLKINEPRQSGEVESSQESPAKLNDFVGDVSHLIAREPTEEVVPLTTAVNLRTTKYARWLVLSLAIVGLLLTVGLFRLLPRHTQGPIIGPQSSDDPSLGLKSERTGADWRVSWNRRAPILQDAISAHVSITDGPTQKDFELGLAELRNGSLVYSPGSDNVLVQLQVKYKNSQQTVSESVRIVAGSPPQTLSKTNPVSSAGGHPTSRVTRLTAALIHAPPKVATAGPAVPEQSRTVVEGPKVEGLDSSNSSGKEKAITPIKANTVSEQTASSSTTVVPSTITPLSGLALKTSQTPPEPSGSAPIDSPPVTNAREPAELIRGGSPVYPLIARQLNLRGSVVVHFRISSTGEVQNVLAVTGSPVLVNAAVQAVKAWRYKPARLNGVPIDTEADITFTFKPN